MKPFTVGLCGLGTVGQGVVALLHNNQNEIAAKAGRAIQLTQVASRTAKPEVDLYGAAFANDALALCEHSDIDLLVETIGGTEIAYQVIKRGLENGLGVVTANKAVVARYGDELTTLTAKHAGYFGFEAAVAGGIPIIGALTKGLAANRINWLAGIINGTSNYILTSMAEHGREFSQALDSAQKLGYAEEDPTFDIEGIDAAHKLAILSALAFNSPFAFDDVYVQGITGLSTEDIKYAKQLGYRIKHLGIARQTPQGIQTRVHPTLIPEEQLLAHVNDVMNAVLVNGDVADSTLYYGAGAGADATASAVVADVIDAARGIPGPFANRQPVAQPVVAIDTVCCAHYLRIPCQDRSGVFAKVATALSDFDISIEAVIQSEREINHQEGEQPWVPIIIITDVVSEAVCEQALEALQALPEVVGNITRIRVEPLANA